MKKWIDDVDKKIDATNKRIDNIVAEEVDAKNLSEVLDKTAPITKAVDLEHNKVTIGLDTGAIEENSDKVVLSGAIYTAIQNVINAMNKVNYIALKTNTTQYFEDGNDKQIEYLEEIEQFGDSFTFDSTNNAITVGAGVTRIKITALLQCHQNTASTRFSNAIKINDADYQPTGISAGYAYISMANNYQNSDLQNMNVIIVTVNEGDVIKFYSKSTSATSGTKDEIKIQSRFLIERLG